MIGGGGLTLLLWPELDRATKLRLAVASGFASVCLVIYCWGLPLSNATPAAALEAPPSFQPGSIVTFYLHTLSGTVAGAGWLDPYLSLVVRDILGALLLLAYVGAFIAGLRQRLYRQSLVPFLMIGYGLLVAVFILLSRFSLGLGNSLSSRYVTHLQLALIGSIWLLLLIIRDANRAARWRFARPVVAAVLVVVLAGQTEIEAQEWVIAPHRKARYQRMRTIARNPELYADPDLALFQATTRASTEQALGILKKHNLNVYSEEPVSIPGPVTFLSGWYDESLPGWMGKSASVRVRTGASGLVRIAAYMSADLLARTSSTDPLELRVFVGKRLMARTVIQPGTSSLDVPLGPDGVFDLRLEASRSFVPSKLGLNDDQRELGLFVTEIRPAPAASTEAGAPGR